VYRGQGDFAAPQRRNGRSSSHRSRRSLLERHARAHPLARPDHRCATVPTRRGQRGRVNRRSHCRLAFLGRPRLLGGSEFNDAHLHQLGASQEFARRRQLHAHRSLRGDGEYVLRAAVGLLRLEGRMLTFLFPAELRGAGSIPLSSSAIAARTAVSRRAECFNNFAQVRHYTFLSSSSLETNPMTIPKQFRS